MKKILKKLLVVGIIVCMITNVYCGELKLNENGFYMMEYNPYIIRGLTEMDFDENDLQVKEKLVSYLSWYPDVSKATLKVDFESEDEEAVEKIIRYLGVDFNENAFRYAKKLKGFHYDIDDIRKDMKNEGFTSDEIFKEHSDATTKFQINVRDYENLNDSEIIAKLKMNNIPDNQINQCLAFIKGNSAALYEAELQVEE